MIKGYLSKLVDKNLETKELGECGDDSLDDDGGDDSMRGKGDDGRRFVMLDYALAFVVMQTQQCCRSCEGTCNTRQLQFGILPESFPTKMIKRRHCHIALQWQANREKVI